jgi:hypothetical protein
MKTYYMQEQSGEVFETCNPEHHKDCKVLSAAEGRRLQRAQYVEMITPWIKEAGKVYGIVRKVSASGMSRNIDLYVIRNNEMVYLTGCAAKILGWKLAKDRGMVVSGCGMDLVFHTVSTLCGACGIDYKAVRSEVL